MKKFYYVLFFLSFTIMNTSCEEQYPLDEIDFEFIGSWSSDRYYIKISRNGFGCIQRRNRDLVEGSVEIRGDRMVFFGNNTRRYRFDIDQFPTFDPDTGFTFMILDGQEFLLH